MSSDIGAIPSTGVIPLQVPEIHGNEWKYIKECLDTNWVSSVGSFVDRFEQMLAEYMGVNYAVSTVNGTAALHIALLVAGVEAGQEVIVPDLTFIAPVNAITYVGAHPILIDANPRTWQMDVDKIEVFLKDHCRFDGSLTINKHTGRVVSAIVPVHLLGSAVDMDPLLALSRSFNLVVIEDATECLGTLYKGKRVGALGDIACFSFNGNKIITTGGGGMVVLNREDWAKRAKYLTTQAKDDPVEYIHNHVGYNYRLVNILAAMGVAQLEVLAEYIEAKQEIARRYDAALKDVDGLIPMPIPNDVDSTYWLYTILVDESDYGLSSRQLLKQLSDQNIQSRPLWRPIHQSPVYKTAYRIGGEVADWLNNQALSLPCSVGLSKRDQEKVTNALRVGSGD